MDLNRVIDRKNSNSIKWSRFEDDTLPLWLADMDFYCSDSILDAIRDRINHGVLGYDSPPYELYSVIKKRLLRLYNWAISEGDISFVPGCVTGFNLALRAYCHSGDSVIVQTPVYGPLLAAPENHNLQRIDNSLRQLENGNYYIDFNDFEKQIIENKVKLFLLCNPHNPVGRVFNKEELLKLGEICLTHNVIICSDEIHSDIIFPGHHHIPIASLSEEIANITLTLISPSKTFNIAGLQSSAMIIQNEKLGNIMKRARAGLVSNPSSLSLIAALAAYKSGDPWLHKVRSYLESNRDFLFNEVTINLRGVNIVKPEGTFLGWLDFRALDLKPDPYTFVLKHARVGLNDGLEYGQDGRGFARLNFGTPKKILKEALERINNAINTKR